MNLHQTLKQIKESHDSTGICSNITSALLAEDDEIFFKLQEQVCELAKGWPEYSGDPIFPVPCEGLSPKVAYRSLPRWEGEYGAARMRLLDFLIEVTKDENQT